MSGDLLTALVAEQAQGHTDLNGDSDTQDAVLFVHDALTSTTTNVGLAALSAVAEGRLVAFTVLENSQGGSDLNSDADHNDLVLHVFDADTGSVTNLHLAVASLIQTDGEHVLFHVNEAAQGGTDLNGDGDANDEVAQVWSASAGISNVGVAVFGGTTLHRGRLVLRVSEAGQGGADLNGDGDAADGVLEVFDIATGTLTNVGRAATGCFPAVGGDLVAFCVPEASEGRGDLNGDGDTSDPVLHVYDASVNTTRNVGLWVSQPRMDGPRIAFDVYEAGQGADLNGDGDKFDPIAYVLDGANAAPANLGRSSGFMWIDGDLVAFAAGESFDANTDLNGDGDALDFVIQIHDFRTNTTTNTGLASNSLMRVDANSAVFAVQEQAQGNTDLNADGDTLDTVLHVFDSSNGATENLRLAVGGFELSGTALYPSVSEAAQGSTDLNDDGDAGDFVRYFHSLKTGETLNLKLADRGIARADEGRAAFDVLESAQGRTDLNGDGDLDDSVLHLFTPAIDDTPPTLAVTVAPGRLFPPNHKYVTVVARVGTADDSGEVPQVTLVGVTSDEPDDAPGDHDGNTIDDIVVVDTATVHLRAERDETADGRVYTLTYRATDGAGNTTTASISVTVPLSGRQ